MHLSATHKLKNRKNNNKFVQEILKCIVNGQIVHFSISGRVFLG